MKPIAVAALAVSLTYFFNLPVSAQAPPSLASQATPSVSGTVQQYLLSPHGEVEGLLLSDGTCVRFPKHLGATLTSLVMPGDPVDVLGFSGPATPQGRAVKALTITNAKTGQVVIDQPPATRPLPPEQRGLVRTPLTVSGIVTRFLVNPKGDVDGLVLSGGEQVKFAPHRGGLLVGVLGQQPGSAVQASGLGTRNSFGTVVAADSLVVGGQTIWLAGKRKK